MQDDSLNITIDSLAKPTQPVSANTDTIEEVATPVTLIEQDSTPEQKETSVIKREPKIVVIEKDEASQQENFIENNTIKKKELEFSEPVKLFSSAHTDSAKASFTAMSVPAFINKEFPDNQELVYRNITMRSEKSWVFGLAFFVLTLMIVIQLYYKKHFNSVVTSLVNMQLSDKLMREKNVLVRRLFFILNVVYLLALSFYFYRLAEKIGFTNLPFNPLSFYLLIFVCVSGVVMFRMIVNYLIAYIFDAREVFREYLHNSYVINKNLGISLLPIIASTFFVAQGISNFLFIIATVLVVLAVLFRYLKATQIILRHNVFLFYSILYLCTLEILPALIGVKFVLMLR